MSGTRVGPTRTNLAEERDFLLRSLRDLEAERAAGDIDEIDYVALRGDYTTRAATVLRQIEALDQPPAPDQPRAEPAEPDGPCAAPTDRDSPEAGGAPPTADRERPRWSRGRAVVTGAVVVALAGAGVGWAIASATGSRAPGGVATGQAVGQEKVAELLLAAEQATAKGDGVAALKDLQAVLAADPNQYVALTDEGWILAQTQQPQLLTQGIGLLTKAATLRPDYPPTRIYRGVAYLAEGDYADAVTDLQWYLAHDPDPQLVPRVLAALVKARAGAARPVPTTAPAG